MHPRHCQLLHCEVLSGSRPQPLHFQSLLSDLLRNCMPAPCVTVLSRSEWENKAPCLAQAAQTPSLHVVPTRGGTSLSLADSFPAMGTSSWKADDVGVVIASIVLPLFLCGFDALRLSNKRQESVRNTVQYGSTRLDQRNTLHHLSNCHTLHIRPLRPHCTEKQYRTACF